MILYEKLSRNGEVDTSIEPIVHGYMQHVFIQYPYGEHRCTNILSEVHPRGKITRSPYTCPVPYSSNYRARA